ncbi:type IV pili twitching motility protein PilT [Acidihalobacter yilgarnensis]|uniref:Type IV pili twitching motility protein PilT n=1 Tax=Acidihalobacter yilgarnensis TaxID=2819280 RepID=A0A1D8IKX3_9GAMM|nr:PilT/PilU family type 4a pilus ATPase [Acidihalobacter yilgarnensis]AOU97041.1 type IV pili twitching motility protein PilT [Acidihalobacter yilgarnensis]
MSRVDRWLSELLERGGSDMHLIASQCPRMRLDGQLEMVADSPLASDEVETMAGELLGEQARARFERDDGVDFAYQMGDTARFRVNLFRHLGGLGLVMRAIPQAPQSLEALKLPTVLRSLCQHKQGLVLVTGKTGSGKSTTLAAMVDFINTTRRSHILTIEDPIEFMHQRKRSLISQREIGEHTPSFAAALRSALREDPDVILVGELRDHETIALAVTAAETGILVLGTLHTRRADLTVDRLINVFPAGKQSQVRIMLSTSLRGVVAQQLLRRADDQGRVAATEVLVNTSAVSSLIRDGKVGQLETAMQSGALMGMQTMDGDLRRLLDAGMISGHEAYAHSTHKEVFRAYLGAGEPL